MNLNKKFEAAFENDEVVIEYDLKFKSALGIGEKAFKTLKVRENLSTFAEALGVGTAVGGVANTVTIGSILGYSGGGIFGTSLLAGATVPGLNVVIIASVVSAGAYVGVSRYLSKDKNEKLQITPKFINTPLDLLATSLANFFIPIALKLSLADGKIDPNEETTLTSFLIHKWGYSESYIKKTISVFEKDISEFSYKPQIIEFRKFLKSNQDCEPIEITNSFMGMLNELINADGMITENEEMELKYIKELLLH